MDFNNSYNNKNGGGWHQPYTYPLPPKPAGGSFAAAAMVLGILAIASTMILPIYLPFVLGSLAVLFALLSKGRAAKLSGKAVAGVTCGAIGLSINVAIFCFSMYYMLSHPELLIETAQSYDTMIEQMYGVPSEEFFGESMEDMMENLIHTFE